MGTGYFDLFMASHAGKRSLSKFSFPSVTIIQQTKALKMTTVAELVT